MCGRYASVFDQASLEELYGIKLKKKFTSRYNIAPTQYAAVLRLHPQSGERELIFMKWGFIPFWVAEKPAGGGMINARAETVAEKPFFRDSFKKRRTLIPASGFYEWKQNGNNSKPFFIAIKDQNLFSLAGLWDKWGQGDCVLESFAIITTDANKTIWPVHQRMPVIVPPRHYQKWLDPGTGLAELAGMLKPYPAEQIIVYAVSDFVNNPANDGPACLAPSRTF